jgi:acyl-coenzyme A thioesterase PaaI-like protein
MKIPTMDGSSAHAYGVANPEEISHLTGKEILQAIIGGRLPYPPISETLTFRLVEIGDGFATFEGEPGDHVLNPMGTAHGSWAMTLIDSATGAPVIL